MVDRPDVARFAGVDRPDRDPRDGHPPADRQGQHLDLELEAALLARQRPFHQPPAEEPVARLVVRDLLPDRPRKRGAAKHVREAADRRHPAEVPLTDHQLRPRWRCVTELRHELRQLRGIVLAVPVQRHGGIEPLVEGQPEARPERCTLALVRDLAKHARAGRCRARRRVVARAVVDHEHGQVRADTADDRLDPRSLIVGRHDREDARRGVGHRISVGRRDALA